MKPYVKNFLKSTVPVSVWKRMLRTSLQLVPVDYKAKNGLMSMWWSIANLKKLGYSPQTIIDVGAYQGDWTKSVNKIFPEAKYLIIEPQPERAAGLSSFVKTLPNMHFESALAGAEDNIDQKFNVLKTGSSVYQQRYQGKASSKTITLPTYSLDTLVKRNHLKADYFLKLDVQGYELEVLKGASHILKDTEVVLMEACLLNFIEGAPLLDEVMAFMREKKYLPFDICEFHRKNDDGVLNYVDVIFIKEDSALRNKVNF